MNAYAYGSGRPLTQSDPLGLQAVEWRPPSIRERIDEAQSPSDLLGGLRKPFTSGLGDSAKKSWKHWRRRIKQKNSKWDPELEEFVEYRCNNNDVFEFGNMVARIFREAPGYVIQSARERRRDRLREEERLRISAWDGPGPFESSSGIPDSGLSLPGFGSLELRIDKWRLGDFKSVELGVELGLGIGLDEFDEVPSLFRGDREVEGIGAYVEIRFDE